MTHTPGPWIVVESDTATVTRLAAWICTLGNNPDDPAVFSTAMDGNKFIFGDKIADARLVAAAPELLEALKDARYALYGNGAGNPKIDAAIAKAEGRS